MKPEVPRPQRGEPRPGLCRPSVRPVSYSVRRREWGARSGSSGRGSSSSCVPQGAITGTICIRGPSRPAGVPAPSAKRRARHPASPRLLSRPGTICHRRAACSPNSRCSGSSCVALLLTSGACRRSLLQLLVAACCQPGDFVKTCLLELGVRNFDFFHHAFVSPWSKAKTSVRKERGTSSVQSVDYGHTEDKGDAEEDGQALEKVRDSEFACDFSAEHATLSQDAQPTLGLYSTCALAHVMCTGASACAGPVTVRRGPCHHKTSHNRPDRRIGGACACAHVVSTRRWRASPENSPSPTDPL